MNDITPKEAIANLNHLYGVVSPDIQRSLDVAIKCMEERPQGEWINHRNDYGHNIADCSLCGKAMQWHDEDEDGIPRYCWYCGAKMKGGKENDR